MKLSYTAETRMLDEDEKLSVTEHKIIGGMNAGICYGAEGYYNTDVTNPEKAFKRFGTVIKTGHHSVSGHVFITAIIEGVPKIVAMILNSLGEYNTSEKSGRYTEMTGNSEEECEKYTKWVGILSDVIRSHFTEMDDKQVTKLAMENARYLLSVFTPTTMSYTTSERQWNYIIDWCDRFVGDRSIANNYFNNELKVHLNELSIRIRQQLYTENLRDFKGRKFNFLAKQVKNSWADFTEDDISLRNTYQTMYRGSFVELAQAQRHRTIDYFMLFDGESKRFFVPYIIRGTKYEAEWLQDISSLAGIVPQGTLVDIVETGTMENFLLKCCERLCGRAQIEICKQTAETLIRMKKGGQFTNKLSAELNKYIGEDLKVNTKCVLLNGCAEACMHGKNGALDRLI